MIATIIATPTCPLKAEANRFQSRCEATVFDRRANSEIVDITAIGKDVSVKGSKVGRRRLS